MKVTISLTLDTERDKHILDWLEAQPKRRRSEAMREAINTFLERNGVTLRDVYEAIQGLRQSGIAVQAGTPQRMDIPQDVLENLSKLGLVHQD